LLKGNYETRTSLQNIIINLENQFERKLKILRSDSRPKLFMHDFFNNKEFVNQISCVETPQQDDIVEQKHQHIMISFFNQISPQHFGHLLSRMSFISLIGHQLLY